MRAANRYWLLGLLLVVYAVVEIQHVYVTPFPTGPDERAHLAYIESIALRGELPAMGESVRTSGERIVTPEAQHPPLYHLLAAPVYRLFIGRGEHAAWVALRLFSALLGLVFVILCWLAARELPAGPLVRYGVPSFVALLPAFNYETSTTNNDALAVALSGLIFLAIIRLLAKPPAAKHFLLLGVALGLAALTRPTTLTWWPAALLALYFVSRRPEWSRPRAARRVALVILPFVVIVGWWWARSVLLYGTPIPRVDFRPAMQFGELPTAQHFIYLGFLAEQAIVNFYLPYFIFRELTPIAPLLWLVSALTAISVAGFVVRRVLRRAPLAPTTREAAWCSLAVFLACLLSITQQAFFVDWTMFLIPGRYLLNALPAAALLFWLGVDGLTDRPAKRWTVPAMAALLLGLNLFALSSISRFYALHPPG